MKTQLLLIFGFIFAVIILMTISETTGKKQAAPTPPDIPCTEIFKNVTGITINHSLLCYDKQSGMFIEPIVTDNDHPAYIARIEAAKDSLRRVYE